MYKVPRNKSKKIAREKAIYFKSRELEDQLFHLVKSGKLDESEMKTLEEYKSRYNVWRQLGEKLAKKAEFKFDFGKYYTYRKSLLEKYNKPVNEKQDDSQN